jgi:hypothetical protein
LTTSSVGEAEQELGVVLPTELLEPLRLRNGGPVAASWSTFPTNEATSWSADHAPFDSLFGIGRDEHGVTLLDSPYLVKKWGLSSPVVLLSGDVPPGILSADIAVLHPRRSRTPARTACSSSKTGSNDASSADPAKSSTVSR